MSIPTPVRTSGAVGPPGVVVTRSFAALPLAEWRRRVLALYEPPLMSAASHRNMKRALNLIVELMGPSATTGDLTTEAVARFVASRHGVESPNTTRTHLSRLSAACGLAVAEGWLLFNPVSVRRRWVRSVSPKVPRIHSREEIARVLALAASEAGNLSGWEGWRARRLEAVFALVAYTGLRRMEALTLRVPEVDLAGRMIYVTSRVEHRTKTEESAAPVPIAEELAPILASWIEILRNPMPAGLPGSPHFHRFLNRGLADCTGDEWLFPASFRGGAWKGGRDGNRPCDRLQALGRRAGVPGLTFSSLRHAWASHAEFWGLTEVQVQRILRHSNTRTQRLYRHAELENLRGMVAPVTFGSIPSAGEPPPCPIERGRRLTSAGRAEVAELRSAGWSLGELQARFGCSKSTITRALARASHGTGEALEVAATIPSPVRAKWAPLTPELEAELARLRAQGWTVSQLARRFNCSRSTVYAVIARVPGAQ